ncbi:uncharacterized protein (TIGR02099 family) [Methylohalomonas lacus]|uniref:Uncharacterized protein (TIGR02099 family) n=1 Tax=Methylohalomonas lacus TaxID=398773 RepID=A0AAE3L0D8_9GAMM|nr:YhdP family protein [Methylohalomonas lacus]MCS3902319.1 uncharacterized protein (TIGR02099 family) [Methylohalomonas lacus]
MIRQFYNACWYLVGGLILLAAVAVTIVRLLLPGIDDYRADIEQLVSQYSGYPVSIDAVSAQWQGWQPQLHLKGVTLHAPEGGRPLAGFASADIRLAVLASLWHQQPMPESLVISGARLKLIHSRDGLLRFTDQRFDSASTTNPEQTGQFGNWLLSQPLISLRDTRLLVIDEQGNQPPLRLSDTTLNLRHWQGRTQIDGAARLPQHYGDAVRFAMDINGDLLTSDWAGTIYIEGRKIKPSAWPQYSRWQDINIRAGRADVRLWSKWQNARLSHVNGLLALEDTLVRGHGNSNLIREFSGMFNLQRDSDDSWQAAARISRLQTWNGNWPETILRASGKRTASGQRVESAYVSHLAIEDVIGLAGMDGRLATTLADWTGSNQPHGHIEQLLYRHETADGWQLSGRLSEVGIDSISQRNRVSGISAEFALNEQRGRLRLASQTLGIADPTLFAAPINDIGVTGTVDWFRHAGDSWLLRSDGLHIDTRPQRLSLRGKLQLDGADGTHVDLAATLSGGDIEPLKRFIPQPAKDKLKNWLRDGLVSGRLARADLVLRGDLDEFPFKDGQGQFKLESQFNDVNMVYHPEWPPIYHIDGEVSIDDDRLIVRIPGADVYNARLHDVEATISDLYAEDHTLNIDGQARGSTADARRFLQDSPLRERGAIQRLLDLELAGDLDIDLALAVALFPEGEDVVSGEIELLDNRIVSPGLGLTLEQARGYIAFNNDKIDSRDLRATYYETPVDLTISRAAGDNAPVRLRMQGRADVDLLERIVRDKIADSTTATKLLREHVQGASYWQFEIEAATPGDKAEQLSISSDLDGMALDLPPPLGKPATERRPLQLQLELADGTDAAVTGLTLDYADILNARQSGDGLAVRLGGNKAAAVSDNRVVIDGRMDTLDVDAWLDFLAAHDTAVLADATIKPFDIDIRADTLAVYGQRFNNTRLAFAVNADASRRLRLDGPAIAGHADLPADLSRGTVNAEFERLHLQPIEERTDDNDEQNFDPRDFPALEVSVADFRYGDSDLGRFRLTADRTTRGLDIREIGFHKPGLDISGNGTWQNTARATRSQFNLELQSERIGEMLSTFGYTDETIAGGQTALRMQASWPGSPMTFSLASLNGSLDLAIEEGRFLDIDPKAGRLFGLLSIQTLPRRLSLDFEDLFSKGFAFDRIRGSFSLEDGQAYTSDLTMEGPAALITVTGRTGLAERNYDQIVSVVPQVSDSLPVASALFGPIGIGVGAAIFLTGQIFESIPKQINRMLGYQYRITGSWEDPVIEQMTRTQQAPQSPPLLPEMTP